MTASHVQAFPTPLWVGDWQDAKALHLTGGWRPHIMTVAKDSPFVGDVLYPLIDGPAEGNGKLFIDSIEHLDVCLHEEIPTLVHCVSGVSRSCAVVIGYLMRTRNISYNEALTELRKVRPSANPVPFFVEILNRI